MSPPSLAAALALAAAKSEGECAAGQPHMPGASPSSSPPSALKLPLCRRNTPRMRSVTFGATKHVQATEGARAAADAGEEGEAQFVAAVACSPASTCTSVRSAASCFPLNIAGTPACSPSALSTKSGASTPGARENFWQSLAGTPGVASFEYRAMAFRNSSEPDAAAPVATTYCAYLYQKAARSRGNQPASTMPRCKV
mmetsp:Transcript_936/g.3003  ORF Transcript_936/g.3003 Transcript_936/m.3003 type:complete len:198 (-) Transcript_936:335-928(-)